MAKTFQDIFNENFNPLNFEQLHVLHLLFPQSVVVLMCGLCLLELDVNQLGITVMASLLGCQHTLHLLVDFLLSPLPLLTRVFVHPAIVCEEVARPPLLGPLLPPG